MPRQLFDGDGNAVEVPDENEIKAYQEAQAKVSELDAKIKELEADSDPDWRTARKKMKDLSDERDDWKKKAEKAGVEVEPKPLPTEDIGRIAEERAEKVYIERYRDRRLAEFGDKREAVGRFFEKLSNGEKLDENKVDELIMAAARTAGVEVQSNPVNRAMGSSSTSAPNFDPTNNKEKDFADSDSGKGLAAAMGLTQAQVKPKQ